MRRVAAIEIILNRRRYDVAREEIGRCLQKCLQVLQRLPHVGVKTFRRTSANSRKQTRHRHHRRGPVQIIVEASGF